MQRRRVQERNRRVVQPYGLVPSEPSSRICLLNKNAGIVTTRANVNANLSAWDTTEGLDPIADADPYILTEDTSNGYHRVYTASTVAGTSQASCMARAKRIAGSRNFRIRIGGSATATFLLSGAGAVVAEAGGTGSIVGPDAGGYYSCRLDGTSITGGLVTLFLCDRLSSSYLGDGVSTLAVTDVLVDQVLDATWKSLQPVGPVADQPNPDLQPYYGNGSAGLRFDGVDDFLDVTGLASASTSHTWVFCIAVGPSSGTNTFFCDVETGRLGFGRHFGSDELGVYVGAAGWRRVSGLTAALPLSVVSFLFDGVSGMVAIRINGTPQVLNAYTYPGNPIADRIVLGGSYVGGNNSQCDYAALSIHETVLPANELANEERFIGAIGGIVL